MIIPDAQDIDKAVTSYTTTTINFENPKHKPQGTNYCENLTLHT